MDNNINNSEDNVKAITIPELWDIFLKRIWLMLLAALIAVGGFLAYVFVTYVPQYKSTATLYVLKQNESSSTSSNAYSDFTLAMNVVNDCTYMLKSHAVVDEVLDKLDLDLSYASLSNSITTANPDDTRVLNVSVTASSPEEAKRIVDCVCEIGSEKISKAMGFNQVNLFEYGTLDYSPSNKTSLSYYIIVGVVAALAVYAVFVIMFIFDDSINDEQDVTKFLGLTVIGDIPNTNSNHKNKRGYYYSGYGHSSGKAYQSPLKSNTSGKDN